MIKNLLVFVLIAHYSCSLFAQNVDFDFVETKYVDYFKLKPETIYTQVNKTKYSITEEVWFKSYIYNTQTQKPYLTTSNVYASIYNADGQLIDKKIYYAENGTTRGNFSLKENYTPGIYFLKVSTSWMKNFNEPYYSLQQFEILGSESITENITETEQKYDFQLLPEGGHLLVNANNSIGFKTVDANGDALVISLAKVLDSQGNTVSTFKGNNFGIGKFNLFISENETYTVEATLADETIISQKIPKANVTGLAFSVNNLNQNTLFIRIKTNKKTLPYLLNKPHHLLIHRDGLLKKIDINFEPETLEYTMGIPKKDLYSGINILTVFNEKNQALLERLVFHKTENLTEDISFIGKKIGYDSTQIRLTTNKKNNLKKTISVSVLPTSTEAYNGNNTITSAFLLKPYVKGHIENPNAYFANNDRKSAYNLDLLLLTQGWSRYDWSHVFFKPQIAKYNFETGFQLQGKINEQDASQYKEVILFSANNELMLTSDVKDAYFSFENLSLMNNSVLSLSAENKRGKLVKPNVYYNVYPTFTIDSIVTKKTIKQPVKITLDNENFIYNDYITELDTIRLAIKEHQAEEKLMITGGVYNRAIDLKTYSSFSTKIIDVIRNSGFDVLQNGTSIEILSRRMSNQKGKLRPQVYLDDMMITNQLEMIRYLTVSDVRELYVAKTGYGINGAGGSINIYSTRGSAIPSKFKGNFNNNEIKLGYSMPKSYYAPLYNKTKRDAFSKLGVLNWVPSVAPNAKGEFIFDIPNYFYDAINLYIEGMSEDGSLISKVETIQLN